MKVLITCTYKITDIRTFYLFIDPNLTITAFFTTYTVLNKDSSSSIFTLALKLK